MSRTEAISVRVESELKREAESAFGEFGLSVSETFGLFCHQIVMRSGSLFEVEIPNGEVLATICRVSRLRGIGQYSIEDFRENMNSA